MYEGFLLQELESVRYQWLSVSLMEWLDFATDLLQNRFYSIALQACENALSSLHRRDAASDEVERVDIVEILNIKEHALKAAASCSVRGHAMEHLKSKASTEKRKPQHVQLWKGDTLFRNGIKMRNVRKLSQSQSVT